MLFTAIPNGPSSSANCRVNPTTERQWESYGAEGQKRLVEGIHLRRLGTSEDIAHAVMFLASDYAGWISGQILQVDGGRA